MDNSHVDFIAFYSQEANCINFMIEFVVTKSIFSQDKVPCTSNNDQFSRACGKRVAIAKQPNAALFESCSRTCRRVQVENVTLTNGYFTYHMCHIWNICSILIFKDFLFSATSVGQSLTRTIKIVWKFNKNDLGQRCPISQKSWPYRSEP